MHGNSSQLDRLDEEVHGIIAETCGNSVLMDLREIVCGACARRERPQRTQTAPEGGKLVVISRRVAEHRRIVEAVRAGDPAEANRADAGAYPWACARNVVHLPGDATAAE
ncbi:FCD domain-containing protein [Frigidibacter albus]|uniref:FCD domain-containing protein n=1 Tax=Frigidibacter albus TaxID=1465486 RepID=A0A6L8VBJ9_9RHOB|nr:FCD domain-containing protein [Frigidibacter albus]MZQ87634.1 FCD domain-containing protein [Frigidibacter albus]NBE29540.1 FCD domain-containing protein [Frigidibacter albus]GGH44225.1 hypothetical protein GCM10011341_03410 [Frigidibacter albus]